MRRAFASFVLVAAACGAPPAAEPGAPEPVGATAPTAAPAPAPVAPPPAAPSPPALPAPTIPAAWPTTMGSTTIDEVHVVDVGSTCDFFALLGLVQTIGRAAAACPDLPGTTVVIELSGGHVTALRATGPAAACVDAAERGDVAGTSCIIQLTFAAAAE